MCPQPDTRQLPTKPVHDQAAFTAPSMTDNADRDAECRGVCFDRVGIAMPTIVGTFCRSAGTADRRQARIGAPAPTPSPR